MNTNRIKNVDPTKLATPLRGVLKNFAASPYKMAPERVDELKALIDGLGVRITLDATTDMFDFYVDPNTKKITAGLAALERLWAYAYSYTHIFHLYQKYGGGHLIDLTSQPDTEQTRKLLVWAHENELKGKHSPWPSDLPRPDQDSGKDKNLAVGNEMFLLMTGFILLHETGHLVLNHRADGKMTPAEYIKQEYEADDWAANWVLEKWKKYRPDEQVFLKRSLGVAFGLACLAGIELYSARPVLKTHPNTAARMLAVLDKYVPEKPENKAEPRELAWLAAPTILEVHLLKSGKKSVPGKTYAMFRDYLVEAKQLFES